MNGSLEITLILLWKASIYVHYKVKTQWPLTKTQNPCELSISGKCLKIIMMSTLVSGLVLAPYDFLHDITCLVKKEGRSTYRQAIIDRFWLRLSQIISSDLGLAHQLCSLQITKDWHMLPESVRSGIPAFISHSSGCSDNNKIQLIPR